MIAETKSTGLEPVTFLRELPGFGNYRKFALYPIENNPFFYYLKSLDDEELGLILADPFLFFPDYSVELTVQDKKELEAQKKEDLLVFTTVTFLAENKMTTNLAAPIIINSHKKVARQVIISEMIEQMRAPLPAGEEK